MVFHNDGVFKFKLFVNNQFKNLIMEKIQAIKPGPKPKTPDGTPDERRWVTPPNQPKHPILKPHIHKPKD